MRPNLNIFERVRHSEILTALVAGAICWIALMALLTGALVLLGVSR